jgi:DNA recombination protein RmuC
LSFSQLLHNAPLWLVILTSAALGALVMHLAGRRGRQYLQQLQIEAAVSAEKIQQLEYKAHELVQYQQLLTAAKTKNAELQTRIVEQERSTQEKIALLQDAEAKLKTQFENLAGKIFEERGKTFAEQNKTSIDHLISPLREQIGEFKKRIETVYDNENKDRVSLREEISALRRDTSKLNQDALNLTLALKGDRKTQGNWGEMILEKVLERSGLRKGIEYETQGGYRDGDNRLFKPDVIIRLPDNKDLIIDSKVSLSAYERYCATEDDQERQTAIKQHATAVREHIRALSGKDYTSLQGIKSLDFVLLFMPIEAAFVAAFQNDEALFTDAFDHKIVVVTPTTLLATLRTIENIWRYERQNENARILADKAGAVYDKVCGFVEELDKLGKQLSQVHGTYDTVMNRLTHGHGNLIRQAKSFAELGVKVKKTLPANISSQAGIESEFDEE